MRRDRSFLTAGQVTALQLLADGLTYAQAAERERTTRHALHCRTAEARMRLKARTNAEAIAMALRRGYIR